MSLTLFINLPFPNMIMKLTNLLLMNLKIIHIFGNKIVILDKHAFQHNALINQARDPYEEIFVLTLKVYGPKAVRSVRLECQNKYFLNGQKSRLIRALLYNYTNKIKFY